MISRNIFQVRGNICLFHTVLTKSSFFFSVEDHHHEAMAFCWENGFHGVLSDDGEFAMFNPPRLFSAHDIKLSFQHELTSTEFVIDEMAKELDLNPNRFSLVAALLGKSKTVHFYHF